MPTDITAIENAWKVLTLYTTTANLTTAYWAAYLTAVAAIIGYTIAARSRPALRLRLALTVGFLLFSVPNMSSVVNKQSLHQAAAEELVEAAKQTQGRWPLSKALSNKVAKTCTRVEEWLIPTNCLRATGGWSAFCFHTIVDIFVLISIWVRRQEQSQIVEVD
jgi:hypothetical protein